MLKFQNRTAEEETESQEEVRRKRKLLKLEDIDASKIEEDGMIRYEITEETRMYDVQSDLVEYEWFRRRCFKDGELFNPLTGQSAVYETVEKDIRAFILTYTRIIIQAVDQAGGLTITECCCLPI